MEGESGDDSCESSPDSSSYSSFHLRLMPELNEDVKEKCKKYTILLQESGGFSKKTNFKFEETLNYIFKLSDELKAPKFIVEYSKNIILKLYPFLESDLKQFKPKTLSLASIYLGYKGFNLKTEKKKLDSIASELNVKRVNQCILKLGQYFMHDDFQKNLNKFIERVYDELKLSQEARHLTNSLFSLNDFSKSTFGNCIKIASFKTGEEISWESISTALNVNVPTMIQTFYKKFYLMGFSLCNNKESICRNNLGINT